MPRTSQHAVDRKNLADATAIVYGVGYRMNRHDLIELILEKGLPSRVEREAILAARLEGDNTADSDVPAGVDQDEDSQPNQD